MKTDLIHAFTNSFESPAQQMDLDHFPDVRKMVDLGSGRQRQVDNIMLTHYACY